MDQQKQDHEGEQPAESGVSPLSKRQAERMRLIDAIEAARLEHRRQHMRSWTRLPADDWEIVLQTIERESGVMKAAERLWSWVGPGYPDLDDAEERERFMRDVSHLAAEWFFTTHPRHRKGSGCAWCRSEGPV